MKNFLLAILLLPVQIALGSRQPELEAKSFEDLMERIETSEFRYIEAGKMFGFISTQSCMFRSPNIIVFRNYCYPARVYPAQGYTIVSKEFGVIDLYEEKMDQVLKRDVHITQFPTVLAPYLESVHLPTLGLNDISSLFEKMYQRHFPGCWSTNFSYYTEGVDANCSIETSSVIGFPDWARETQNRLSSETDWKSLIKKLNLKFQRP